MEEETGESNSTGRLRTRRRAKPTHDAANRLIRQ
jgi:hypothetical protein